MREKLKEFIHIIGFEEIKTTENLKRKKKVNLTNQFIIIYKMFAATYAFFYFLSHHCTEWCFLIYWPDFTRFLK